MHRVQLAYALADERAADRALHHPLLAQAAADAAFGTLPAAQAQVLPWWTYRKPKPAKP